MGFLSFHSGGLAKEFHSMATIFSVIVGSILVDFKAVLPT